MIRLTTNDHKYLTRTMLKALNQNHIITVFDFLSEDAEKLSILTKLQLSNVIEIRNYFFTNSATIINGIELFERNLNDKKQINTGIRKLDSILCDGIPIGQITELCGLAGSGKSQICMQIAINCTREFDNTVLYIDTKGDFSALRIQKILELYGTSYKDMAQIMLKIKIVNIWTMENLVDFMKNIEAKDDVTKNLCLIIIDSLPALMLQHFGDDNKIGLKFLNAFVTKCRYLSRKLEIAVVCVNIETRWVDQDILDLENDEQATHSTKENVYIERRTRCMGKYWQHIPVMVIHVDKQQENEQNDIAIDVVVKKYNIPNNVIGQCKLSITGMGVT